MAIKILNTVILGLLLIQPFSYASLSARQGSLSTLILDLNKHGFVVDVERGQRLPVFDLNQLDSFSSPNYLNLLHQLLQARGFDCEVQGKRVTIYDEELRTKGSKDPLNRIIGPLKLTNITVDQCLTKLGDQLGVKLLLMQFDGVLLKDISLNLPKQSLRDTLTMIALQSGWQTWTAGIDLSAGHAPVIYISIGS